MTLSQTALEGFLVLMGVLIASYVVGEVVYLYNQKQANQSFQIAVDQMTKSTISAVESIKDTTTLGINSLIEYGYIKRCKCISTEKAEQNQQPQSK